MQAELAGPLRKAVSFLEESGYAYAVIGGIALSQWGTIRATRDVDIKVHVPDVDFKIVRTKILSAFPERTREQLFENPFIVAVTIDGVIVVFLLSLPGYEENIFERAVVRNLGDFSVRICSAEDLIIQKAIANREKDWVDIEAVLLERWGQLDNVYIEDWLAQFAEALETPAILQRYQDSKRKIARLFD